MKSFLVIRTQNKGSQKVSYYQVIKNIPYHIGQEDYPAFSTEQAMVSAFKWFIENKKIPKSKCDKYWLNRNEIIMDTDKFGKGYIITILNL